MNKFAIFLLISSAVFAFHCASDSSSIESADGQPSSCTSCNKPALVTLHDQTTPTTVVPGTFLCATEEFSLAPLKSATVQGGANLPESAQIKDVIIQHAFGANPFWAPGLYNSAYLAGISPQKFDGTHEPRVRALVLNAGPQCPSIHLTIVGYAWD